MHVQALDWSLEPTFFPAGPARRSGAVLLSPPHGRLSDKAAAKRSPHRLPTRC